jgi:hypothetical protein
MDSKECRIVIESDKLNDLIQLTEETDLNQIVIHALSLYYEVQKFRTKEYRLSLVPYHLETGEVDHSRTPIYLNIDDVT